MLFLRRELVAAFTGDLVWDTGSVPCTRLAVLHFHGNGRLVVDWRGADVVALRLSEGQPMLVAEGRILGWIGRLVAQADPGVPVVGSRTGRLRGRRGAIDCPAWASWRASSPTRRTW